MGLVFLHDNIGDVAVPTVTTEDSAFPKVNLFDGRRTTLWKGTSTADHYITFDLGAGADFAADYVVLCRADLLAAASATIVVQYSSDLLTWTDAFTPVALASETLPWPTGRDYVKLFTQVTRRAWRLKITGLTAVPQLAGLWIGTRTQLTDDAMDDPVELGRGAAQRGRLLGGSFSLITAADANLLLDYVDRVTPRYPSEQPIEGPSGAVFGARPHWIYESSGLHFRRTDAVLMNVVLLTPDPQATVSSFDRHAVLDLRWREVVV